MTSMSNVAAQIQGFRFKPSN